MNSPIVRKMIEDRFAIRFTQKLRRPTEQQDYVRFYLDTKGDLAHAENQLIYKVDKIIREYLEELEAKEHANSSTRSFR